MRPGGGSNSRFLVTPLLPPPEHLHRDGAHWLDAGHAHVGTPWRWLSGPREWVRFGPRYSPEDMAAMGWRYRAPHSPGEGGVEHLR